MKFEDFMALKFSEFSLLSNFKFSFHKSLLKFPFSSDVIRTLPTTKTAMNLNNRFYRDWKKELLALLVFIEMQCNSIFTCDWTFGDVNVGEKYFFSH